MTVARISPYSWSSATHSADRPLAAVQLVERELAPPTGAGRPAARRPPGTRGPGRAGAVAAGGAAGAADAGARRTRRTLSTVWRLRAGWREPAVRPWPTGPEAAVPLAAPLAPGSATGRAVDGTAWAARLARWARSTGTAGTAAAGVAADADGSPRRSDGGGRRSRCRGSPDAVSTGGVGLDAGGPGGRPGPAVIRAAVSSAAAASAGGTATRSPVRSRSRGRRRPGRRCAPLASSSRRSLITLRGRKCSRCWRRTQRRRSTSCS